MSRSSVKSARISTPGSSLISTWYAATPRLRSGENTSASIQGCTVLRTSAELLPRFSAGDSRSGGKASSARRSQRASASNIMLRQLLERTTMTQPAPASKECSASLEILERRVRSRAFFDEHRAHYHYVPKPTRLLPHRLDARAFPAATLLNAFFAWNEARYRRDRRYIIACDIYSLLQAFDDETEICVAHLTCRPVMRWRFGRRVFASVSSLSEACDLARKSRGSPAAAAARHLVRSLTDSIGKADTTLHAAVFRAFEELAEQVDLASVARLRSPEKASTRPVHESLIIKLGALGDFIQALGPMPDIRRHHARDRITLLTTPRYSDLAAETGLFDEILIDRRPKALDVGGWLALRRMMRGGRFDRIYDLQTSDRTGIYARLFRPGRMPEWSGIARGC